MVAQLIIAGKMGYLTMLNRGKEKIARGEIEDRRRTKTGDGEVGFEYQT